MKKFLSMRQCILFIFCSMMFTVCFQSEVLAAEADGGRNSVEEQEEITYAPSVLKDSLEEVDAYTIEEDGDTCEVSMPKNEETAEIAVGDHIILPSNEENPAGAALTVTGIAEEEDGLRLVCKEPEELSDFVQSIDISGYGEFLPEQAKGGAASVKARGIGIHLGNQSSKVGRIDYQFQDTLISDAAVLNGTVSVEISSIEYRLKMDVGLRETKVEDFYFAVNHTVDVSADFSLRTDGLSSGGELLLGTVPFVLGQTGVNGEITFWLNYDAAGNVNLTYTLSNVAGLSYENGACRPFARNESYFAMLAGLDFTAGPKMQFILKFGRDLTLMDMTVQTGITGTADASMMGMETDCRLDAFAYLKLIPGADGLVNKALGLKEMEVWNEQTSPFHLNLHEGA